MELAVLIICIAALVLLILGILAVRQDLSVIHDAVNSNMTRALNEITTLHGDVTKLVRERNEARVEAMGLAATEQLSGQLIKAVDGVIEQQKLVAHNLTIAQKAVDGVASDLAESHQRAEEVHENEPAGTAADAASKPSKEEKS